MACTKSAGRLRWTFTRYFCNPDNMGCRRVRRVGGAWLGGLGVLVVAAGACLGCCGLGGDDSKRTRPEPVTTEYTPSRAHEQTSTEDKQRAARRAKLAAMTPAQREHELQSACTGTSCDADATKLVLDAAANAQEHTKLERQLSTLEAAAARQRSKATSPRQNPAPTRPAPPTPRQEPVGRVCCCDGTVSPTCTTVHRGCCSRHGGVCACN